MFRPWLMSCIREDSTDIAFAFGFHQGGTTESA